METLDFETIPQKLSSVTPTLEPKKEPGLGESVPWPQLSTLEKLMVRRFHPRSLMINSAGALWVFYYLAKHELVLAVFFLLAFRLVAYASVWNSDPLALSQTFLGKVARLHLHPVNLIVQSIGLFALMYGVWQHSAEWILGSSSIILLGHLYGWGKVDARWT